MLSASRCTTYGSWAIIARSLQWNATSTTNWWQDSWISMHIFLPRHRCWFNGHKKKKKKKKNYRPHHCFKVAPAQCAAQRTVMSKWRRRLRWSPRYKCTRFEILSRRNKVQTSLFTQTWRKREVRYFEHKHPDFFNSSAKTGLTLYRRASQKSVAGDR